MTNDSPETQRPIEVVTGFFKAYEVRDWNDVAELTHPDSLKELRETIIEDAAGWRIMPSPTEMYPPDTHPAVLEHYEQLHARFAKHGNPVLREMSVGTIEELAALSPGEACVRFLQGNYIPPERYDDGRGPVRTRTPLGVIDESDRLSHVVYRLHTDKGQYGADEELLVISTRRTKHGWRVILNSEVSHRRGGKLEAITDE